MYCYRFPPTCLQIFLLLSLLQINFSLLVAKKQLSEIDISSLNRPTAHSVRNFGFIFDEHLTFSDQLSLLSMYRTD